MAITYHAGRRIQGLAPADETYSNTTRTTGQTSYSSNGSTMTHYIGERFTATKWRNVELKTLVVYGSKYTNSSSGDFQLKVFGSDHVTQIGSTITGTPSVSSMPLNSAGVSNTTVTFDLTGITSPNTEFFIGVGTTSTGGAPSYVFYNNAAAGTDGSNMWEEYNGYTNFPSKSMSFTLTYVGGDAKPTNVQAGSRWEETDTRKMYHKVDNVTGSDVSLTELKAYWKFDEASGDITNQATSIGSTHSIGTGADLQVTGATYNNTNTPFNTMNFDGTNDVAKAGTSTSQFNFMHNGGKFTVSVWVSIDNITDEGYIISDITGTNTNGFGFFQTGDSKFLFRIFDSGIWVDRNMGLHGMTAGTFYFLTFTWDPTESTNKATFYKNGVEITTANQSTSQGSSSNANSVVGVGAQGSNAGWLDCKIAEMAVWNRVLTDAEITSLYNSGSGKEINSDVWKEEGT